MSGSPSMSEQRWRQQDSGVKRCSSVKAHGSIHGALWSSGQNWTLLSVYFEEAGRESRRPNSRRLEFQLLGFHSFTVFHQFGQKQTLRDCSSGIVSLRT